MNSYPELFNHVKIEFAEIEQSLTRAMREQMNMHAAKYNLIIILLVAIIVILLVF